MTESNNTKSQTLFSQILKKSYCNTITCSKVVLKLAYFHVFESQLQLLLCDPREATKPLCVLSFISKQR